VSMCVRACGVSLRSWVWLFQRKQLVFFARYWLFQRKQLVFFARYVFLWQVYLTAWKLSVFVDDDDNREMLRLLSEDMQGF
jgi:hypothetical protein